MIKDYKKLTLKSQLLLAFLTTTEEISNLSSMGSLSRALNPELHQLYRKRSLEQAVRRLWQKGYLKTEYKESKRIFKLTKKGQLEALFEKSKAEVKNLKTWDGNWTIISFDVPENARSVREKLRLILHQFNYQIIHASVYISPHPFPEEGYEYLKTSELDRYITIFTAHKISSRQNFKTKFNLR